MTPNSQVVTQTDGDCGEVVGQEVALYLPVLLRRLGVTGCTVLEFAPQRAVECPSAVEPRLYAVAHDARASTKLGESFHERLLDLGSEVGMFEEVLEHVMAHQPLETAMRRFELLMEDFTPSSLQDLCLAAHPANMVLLLSRVHTRNGEQHIPMLDFRIPVSKSNHALVGAISKRLGPGTIVISGTSYHYYGHNLFSTSELSKWLLRAQLLGRFVDTRWITHQLIEQCCALRIGAGHGYRFPPRILETTNLTSALNFVASSRH